MSRERPRRGATRGLPRWNFNEARLHEPGEADRTALAVMSPASLQ